MGTGSARCGARSHLRLRLCAFHYLLSVAVRLAVIGQSRVEGSGTSYRMLTQTVITVTIGKLWPSSSQCRLEVPRFAKYS
jgi:hypothetical protein